MIEKFPGSTRVVVFYVHSRKPFSARVAGCLDRTHGSWGILNGILSKILLTDFLVRIKELRLILCCYKHEKTLSDPDGCEHRAYNLGCGHLEQIVMQLCIGMQIAVCAGLVTRDEYFAFEETCSQIGIASSVKDFEARHVHATAGDVRTLQSMQNNIAGQVSELQRRVVGLMEQVIL